jgi:hypothetical protein
MLSNISQRLKLVFWNFSHTAPSCGIVTTQVTPAQDVSFQNCDGVSSTSTIRTLDVYGAACKNALLRFDLAVLGSAGMDRASSLTLELPLASAVSGISLNVDYAFSATAGAWNEKSSLVRPFPSRPCRSCCLPVVSFCRMLSLLSLWVLLSPFP